MLQLCFYKICRDYKWKQPNVYWLVRFSPHRERRSVYIRKEKDIPEGSVLAALQQRIHPKHVGWIDEYKAVLYALNIDPDMSMFEFEAQMRK